VGPGPVVISANVQRSPSLVSAFTGTYFCAVVLNRLADHVPGMASVRRGTSAWQAMCAADVLWEPAQEVALLEVIQSAQ
ncbi:hypothetical protein ANCDUO_22118, partial [Ancylostoma duodenale]